MDDNLQLLRDVRRMDAEALAKAFDLFAPVLYGYAYRHCGNTVIADQIVGDVFVKLLEQLSGGKGPDFNLRSYLFEIAYHTIVDEIRYYRRTTSVGAFESLLQEGNSPDMAAEHHILLTTLLRSMQADLTDDQRHVIILRFLEGFSLKETSQIMGKKVGNIKVIQNRAVATLRRAMDDQENQYQHIAQDAFAQQTL